MKYTKFIPTHFLNTQTEEWQDIASVYKNVNFLQMQDFVKIIPIVDNIYLIVLDNYDCSTTSTLYKGILE